MPARLQCENCRRELGPELKSCPRREKNAGCPYQVEESQLDTKGWFFYILAGASFSLLSVTGLLMGTLPIWIEITMVPVLVFGLTTIATGFYLLAGRKTILFNNQTGQSWQQTIIFGLPITQTVSFQIEPQPWLGSPGREMRYPASVAQLYKTAVPADILSTALLQLMAHQTITLGLLKVKPKIGRQKTIFTFSPGEHISTANIDGRLENKLIAAVQAGTQNQPLLQFNQRAYPRTHRAALTLADLLLLVFEGQKAHPGNYLVDQIVGPEAVQLGLGVIKGKITHYLEPAANTRGRIALDIRSTEQLHRDFWTTYPDIASELLIQIDLTILSEITSGAEDG